MSILKAVLLILCFSLGTSGKSLADILSTWNAASGLNPEQVSPPYSLTGSGVPTISESVLKISTSEESENAFYIQSEPLVDMSGSFSIQFSVKYISGTTSASNRSSIFIGVTTAPSMGVLFFIGEDEVFFSAASGGRGASAIVDTDDDFHSYRLEFDESGAITLFYNEDEILTASTYASLSDHGSVSRIFWGEGSTRAAGVSEWQSFEHDALNAEFLEIFQDQFESTQIKQ